MKLDIIFGFEPKVPDSNSGEGTRNKKMKKLFLSIILFCLLSIIFVPFLASAAGNPTAGQPLVPCGNPGEAACTITDFFTMIARVYNFIVWDIATPLAILAFLAGGIIMMVSAGNPGLAGKGRQILTIATIGLVLVFCAWLIVNVILVTLTGHGL